MRSVKTKRKALLQYLAVVIKELAHDAVSFESCRRPEGSYATVSFDGLQLSYRVKCRAAFNRKDVKVQPVPRASSVPYQITNEAVSKAFGRVLSAKRVATAAAPGESITTVTSIRGHDIVVAVLLGDVMIDGVEQAFSGDKPHPDGGAATRGSDPAIDGDVAPALVAFPRGLSYLRAAARTLTLTIASMPDNLRRLVPGALMKRVDDVVAEIPPPSAASPPLNAFDDAGDAVAAREADLLGADAERVRKCAGVTTASSLTIASSEWDHTSGSNVVSSEDKDSFYRPRDAKLPQDPVWEQKAPFLGHASAPGESALETTGGGRGYSSL